MVSVPVRAAPVFAWALKPTEPLAVPLAPEVMESHPALLVAVHAHPLVVVTATVPVPPLAATDWLVGAIVNVQAGGAGGAGAAAWLTVNW
jgi:hypothetical protein